VYRLPLHPHGLAFDPEGGARGGEVEVRRLFEEAVLHADEAVGGEEGTQEELARSSLGRRGGLLLRQRHQRRAGPELR